jgi:hypothetical protein
MEDLIKERGPGYRPKKILVTRAMREKIASLSIPLKSFDNVPAPRNYFELVQDTSVQRAFLSNGVKASIDLDSSQT